MKKIIANGNERKLLLIHQKFASSTLRNYSKSSSSPSAIFEKPIQLFNIDKSNTQLAHLLINDKNNFGYSINVKLDKSPINFLTYHHFNNLIVEKLNSCFNYSPYIYPSIFSIDTHQEVQTFQFTTNNQRQYKQLIDIFNNQLFFPNWNSRYIEELVLNSLEGLNVLNHTDGQARFSKSLISHLYDNTIPSYEECVNILKNTNSYNLRQDFESKYNPSNSLFISYGDSAEMVVKSLESLPKQTNSSSRNELIVESLKDTSTFEFVEHVPFENNLPENAQSRIAIAYKLDCDITNQHDYILLSILARCLQDTYPFELGNFSLSPLQISGINASHNQCSFIIGVEGVTNNDLPIVKNKLLRMMENINTRSASHYLNQIEMEYSTLFNSTLRIHEILLHSWVSEQNIGDSLSTGSSNSLIQLANIRKEIDECGGIERILSQLVQKYFSTNKNYVLLTQTGNKNVHLPTMSKISVNQNLSFASNINESYDIDTDSCISESFISNSVESYLNGRFLFNIQESNGDLIDISLVKYDNVFVTKDENRLHDIIYYSSIAKLITQLGARDASREEMDEFKEKYFPRGIQTSVKILHDKFDPNSVKCGIVLRTQVIRKNLYKALDVMDAMLSDSELKDMPPHLLNDELIKHIIDEVNQEISDQIDIIGLARFSSESKTSPISKLEDVAGGTTHLAFLEEAKLKSLKSFKNYISQFYRQLTTRFGYKLMLTASSKHRDMVCQVAKDFMESNSDMLQEEIPENNKFGKVIEASKEKNRYITIPPNTILEGSRIICRGGKSVPLTDDKAPHFFLLAQIFNEKLFKNSESDCRAHQSINGSFSIIGITREDIKMFLYDLDEQVRSFVDFAIDEISIEEFNRLKMNVMRELGDSVTIPAHERATKLFNYGISYDDYSKFKSTLLKSTIEELKSAANSQFGFQQEQGFVLTVMGTELDTPDEVKVMSKDRNGSWEIVGSSSTKRVGLEEYMLGSPEDGEAKQKSEIENLDSKCSF
ncbi:predicted protein [Naegleria gruberi]|uniref:Predicted protein n=1 Tax=Naegleria gruberi TaxID=5762 RepID=D2UZK7_NAEGR|nr:uncharacterized protein NAEGRDRAFT_61974 [Naegleria gruberi]EFC49959.1 predicted protein [Naegleria gruberi]|eukprot:XP_002682703.1 predicted protein [Naegleria gruberi strain NEG-M]